MCGYNLQAMTNEQLDETLRFHRERLAEAQDASQPMPEGYFEEERPELIQWHTNQVERIEEQARERGLLPESTDPTTGAAQGGDIVAPSEAVAVVA